MALNACGPVAIDRQGRELVEHGTPLFPAACYHDNISGAQVPWHWHDELEVLAVETGVARVSVNGTDYTVRRGEGFFINSGALHAVWSLQAGPCYLRSVVFHPRLVGGSMDSVIWQKYLEPLRRDPLRPCVYFSPAQEWEADALNALQAAWHACASEAEGFELTVREQLSKLIFLLFKHCPSADQKPSEKALRDGERIKVMLHYIQGHYGEALTLAQIAKSAAVSESECLRCFRGMIGCTPIQYVKQVRIQRAAELLSSTHQKIADIGAECGFQEMSYFAKTFRALKGCSPGEFRSRSLPLAEKRPSQGRPAGRRADSGQTVDF